MESMSWAAFGGWAIEKQVFPAMEKTKQQKRKK